MVGDDTPGQTTRELKRARRAHLAAGNAGDVEAVIVAFDDVLLHTDVGYIVVVSLLHWPVSVINGDPLRRWQAQPHLQTQP